MKIQRCKYIFLILIVFNLALFIYYINNESFWPKEKEPEVSDRDIEKLITVVIYDFEHFENDVVNTVNSFLEVYPNLTILVVSNDLPYPPLKLPKGNVKLVVLDVPINQPGENGRPEKFMKTEYTLFVPDGFHLNEASRLKNLIQDLKRASGRIHMIATYAEGQSNLDYPSCDQLVFDYRRWTLKYGYSTQSRNGIEYCDSIHGRSAILVQTSHLLNLHKVFIQPFLKALFIQSALKKWKVPLVLENSPFIEQHQLFRSEHNRWKHEQNRKRQEENLYKKFGIKKIKEKDGMEIWHGCSKETQRCFGTIIDDTPSFIYKGRWTPPCCLRNLRETTRHVLWIFEEQKVKYWLEGGSLLGAARTGDIIPWDYDVDIGMYRNDIEKIPNLKKVKEGGIVEDDDGFVWEKSREGEFYRVQFSKSNHMHVDIFPFYEKNGKMTKDTWFKSHRQDTEFPATYLQPLERLKFVGIDVLVPNHYREFLEFKFGKGVIENERYPDSRRAEKYS